MWSANCRALMLDLSFTTDFENVKKILLLLATEDVNKIEMLFQIRKCDAKILGILANQEGFLDIQNG